MTIEDWEKLKSRLSHESGSAHLTVDGYKLTLISLIDKNRLYIAVFVDDKMKMEWIVNGCEIRDKFYFKSKYCPCRLAEMKKAKLTKKQQRELIEKYTSYTYSPYFKSFRSLKSQLINNNDDIRFEVKDDENA